MSIWISKAVGLTLVLAGLVACQPVPGLPNLPLASATAPVVVLADAVKVAGPRGYCADPSSVQEIDDSAVVLLGRCSADSSQPPALLTVTLGRAGSASAIASGGADLAAFFNSDAGRATLSRSGKARDVTIGTALSQNDVFLMRVEDRVLGPYWRGMVAVKGRLISVSATGPGLAREIGRGLVQDTAEAIRRSNR